MGKYDAVGIQIGVDFESYKSVKDKLDTLLGKFAQSGKTIDIDINIKDVNKQLQEIEKTIKTLDNVSQTVANDMAKAFSKGVKTINKEAEKLQEKAQKKSSVNTPAFSSDDAVLAYWSKIEHQIEKINKLKIDDDLRKELGNLTKELYGLSSKSSKLDLQDFKNGLDDLSKEAKSVDKLAKSLETVKNQINSLPSREELPNGLFDDLNITDLVQRAGALNVRGADGQLQSAEIEKLAQEYNNVKKIIKETTTEINKQEKEIEEVADEVNLLKIKYENVLKSMKVSNIGKYLDPDAVRKFEEALEKLDGDDLKEITKQARLLDQQLASLKNNAQEVANKSSFFGTMSNAFKSMSGYYLSGQMLSKLTNGLKFGVQSIVEMDNALVDLKKVSTETDSTLNNFVGTANKMAIELGHSTTAVINSVTDYIKVGYQFKEAKELANATIVYSNVGDMDIASATEAMISTMKAFNEEGLEAIEIVDRLNEVANKYAVTAGGLGEALKRSASSLSVAGNNLDQSLGLIAGANAVVQNESKVGNALKTISMRLRGISEDTGELIPNLRETFMLLTNNKVDIMADEDTFKSTYDIMVELGTVWDTLTDKQRAYLAELSAGKTQANVFVSIMENIEDVEKAYVDSMNSQGSAMREQEAYMNSLQAKINTLRESIVAFWNNLVDSGAIATVLDGLTSLVNLATKLVDIFGSLPAILMTLGGGLGALNPSMMKGLTGDITKFFTDARAGISLINEEAIKLGDNGKKSIGGVITATTQMISTSKTATTAMSVLGTTIKSIGLGFGIGLVIQGVVSLIKYVSEADERLQETIDNARANVQNVTNEIQNIENLSEKYNSLSESIGSLEQFYKATSEQQKEYLELSKELLEVSPSLAVAYTAEGEAIVLAGQSLDGEIEKKREYLQLQREILAFNSTKQLVNKVDARDDALKDITKKKQEIEKEKRILEELKKGDIVDGTVNMSKISHTEETIAKLSNELRELQVVLHESESDLSNTMREILSGSESFLKLDSSAQTAVQSLLNFNENLALNSTGLEDIIQELDGILGAFDDIDFSNVKFDEDLFGDVQTQLEKFLVKLGFTGDELVNVTTTLLSPYKNAWLDSNNAVKPSVDTLKVFNDQLKTLGGEVLDYSDKILTLKNALKELDTSHGLSSQTLRSLVDEYPALITAIGDEEKQRRILMDAVKEQETLQEQVIENILELEKQAHIQKVNMDDAWYANKKEVILGVLKNVAWANQEELQQAKNLAEAKMAIDNAYAKAHARLMKKLYNASMPKSVNLMEGTQGSALIKQIDAQIALTPDGKHKEELERRKQLIIDQEKVLIAQSQELQSSYKQVIDELDNIALEGLDLSGIGANLKNGINKVNTPSASKQKEKKEKQEKTATYDGNELDKYANALDIIIEKIDDYDEALEQAHAKKERLHDKQLYEEEIAYIDTIIEKEKHRGLSYQNRIKEIEANNKAVLEAFKKQEGFTLSKFTKAELDQLFNEKYGAKKEWKGENADKEKKAWEEKAKAFQNYVDTYFKGVETIEDLNSKLLETNEAISQLNFDKYTAQLEVDKRKLETQEKVVDGFEKELDILRELNQEDFSLQNYDTIALEKEYELLGNIAGKQHLVTEEIKAQINANMALLATLDETDARYSAIVERVKELTDAQHDSYMKELQYRNEIKNKLIEQMSVELEQSLYGSGGKQAWEDENNAKINALEEELELLKKQTDEKKKQEEAEKRQLEIQKLREKLENLKRQKTVQQLKKNADGSWEWEYVADQEAIAKVEQEIKDKEKEQQEKEEEEAKKKEEEALQDKIDNLKDEAKIRAEAYQRMLNDLRKHMNSQENIFEMSGKDIQDIVNSTMNSLDKLYNGKFSSIVESIRKQASELSSIFEDARDEAEDWYEGAVDSSNKNDYDDDKPNKVPPTSKPDKTDEEKEAWHANKDRIARQMQKNAQAWKTASASEKKRLEQENEKLGKSINAWKNASTGVWYIKVFDEIMPLFDSIGYRKFKTGGETQETGFQWLDGKKGKPERVLSAEQTKSFNRMVEIMPDFMRKMELFSSIAPNLTSLIKGAVIGDNVGTPNVAGATPISGTNGQTIIVENIELPNVTDADAFRKEMAQFLQGSFSGLSQSAKVQKSK